MVTKLYCSLLAGFWDPSLNQEDDKMQCKKPENVMREVIWSFPYSILINPLHGPWQSYCSIAVGNTRFPICVLYHLQDSRTEAHEQDTMKEYGTWEQTHVQIVTLHEMCSNFLLHNKLGCLSSVLPNTANVESSGIARRSDFFAA